MTRVFNELISFDEAQQLLSTEVSSLNVEHLSLSDVNSLILAQDIVSNVNLPHNDVSAMDGYAVNSEDLDKGICLPISIEIPAGSKVLSLPNGTVARIFTGAAIPEGANIVIQQENVRLDSQGNFFANPKPIGYNIRRKSELVKKGELIASQGTIINPMLIGLLASLGYHKVLCNPKPTVSIVVTGDELKNFNDELEEGEIFDGNGPMLRALVSESGYTIFKQLIASDKLKATVSALEKGFEQSDVVISTGGVSVGDLDFIPEAIQVLGGEILFHGAMIKPGRPTLVAKLGDKYLVGLPGNPVAVLTGWRLFALPILERLAGFNNSLPAKPFKGTLSANVKNKSERTLFTPATVNRNNLILPLNWKGSHDVFSASKANAIVRIEGYNELFAGEEAQFFRL